MILKLLRPVNVEDNVLTFHSCVIVWTMRVIMKWWWVQSLLYRTFPPALHHERCIAYLYHALPCCSCDGTIKCKLCYFFLLRRIGAEKCLFVVLVNQHKIKENPLMCQIVMVIQTTHPKVVRPSCRRMVFFQLLYVIFWVILQNISIGKMHLSICLGSTVWQYSQCLVYHLLQSYIGIHRICTSPHGYRCCHLVLCNDLSQVSAAARQKLPSDSQPVDTIWEVPPPQSIDCSVLPATLWMFENKV